MKPPNDLKGIQYLNERIMSFNRFISKCINKCVPFFKLLLKSTLVFWNED